MYADSTLPSGQSRSRRHGKEFSKVFLGEWIIQVISTGSPRLMFDEEPREARGWPIQRVLLQNSCWDQIQAGPVVLLYTMDR
jgi:hypothetical protein